MRARWKRGGAVAVAVALAAGRGAVLDGHAAGPPSQSTGSDAGDVAGEIAKLKEEIERLKAILPDQAHAMKDVAYHFSNLWFAGQARNWPLARFYLDETRSHLRWAVRIRPTRATKGGEVDLRAILEGLDRSRLQDVQVAIEARDAAAFARAYRDTLGECHACHQASDKPYLRPRVPEAPEGRLIEFAPGALER